MPVPRGRRADWLTSGYETAAAIQTATPPLRGESLRPVGEREHDDLVLALALAAERNSWYARHKGEGTVAEAEATGIWGVVGVYFAVV